MSVKRAVVTGYATLDYVAELAERFDGTGTRLIGHRPKGGWPRAGGAALFASRALSQAGVPAVPLTWVGGGLGGQRYMEACRSARLDCSGISVVPGRPTPVCVLAYQPDGSYGCLFDPGLAGSESLTDAQIEKLSAADLVCIAVGPPALGRHILSHVRDDAMVAWIAKTDHSSYPPDLREQYADRADIIFCNSDERAFADASRRTVPKTDQVIVETRGSQGVVVSGRGASFEVPAGAVQTADTTGAGDTLAGATLARLLEDADDLKGAVERGVIAARRLLEGRKP